MRWILIFLVLTQILHAGEKTLLPKLPGGKSWKMVWNDEFEGAAINATKWELPDGARRDHWWSPKCAFLDGKGHLVLRTKARDGKFFSPCLRTRGKYEKAFGYFVTRCKLPKELGHWTAFWLYAPSVNKVGDDIRKAKLRDDTVVDYVSVFDVVNSK